jgi:hypothetical protein
MDERASEAQKKSRMDEQSERASVVGTGVTFIAG